MVSTSAMRLPNIRSAVSTQDDESLASPALAGTAAPNGGERRARILERRAHDQLPAGSASSRRVPRLERGRDCST